MLLHARHVDVLRTTLLDFLSRSGRAELPWRRRGVTAYEVWVSEIMLQQTQVSRVIKYYERFLTRFPTVKKLSLASWETFLPYYEGLGYYARGRNMLRTAKIVVKEHSGKFPRSIEELETLPGVGPYTARAIASFAYGAPVLAWDTNVRRVIGRFFFGTKDGVNEEAKGFFDRRLGQGARQMNAALMDFGSALCSARPKCGNCPLQPQCQYAQGQGRDELSTLKSKGQHPKKRSQQQAERAVVFLHAEHRHYFSATPARYQPFVLPLGYRTRAAIKEYFLRTYGLALAVRPPHAVTEGPRGKRLLLVNAQILLGQPMFSRFPKSAVLEYTNSIRL